MLHQTTVMMSSINSILCQTIKVLQNFVYDKVSQESQVWVSKKKLLDDLEYYFNDRLLTSNIR